MATTIKLKNSVTTTNTPTSLAQGEVAINVTDKKVWVGNAATTPVQLLGGGADGTFTNLAYTGTLTGGTGVVNLGSGQFIKDASGNIGVGTGISGAITPSLRLGNSGSGGGVVTATLSLGSFSTGYGSNLISSSDFSTSSASYLAFGTTPSGASGLSAPVERMRITSDGLVGIGTSSPSSKFDVRTAALAAAIQWSDNINSTGFLSTVSGGSAINSNTALVFGTGTSSPERMRIDTSGNCGIGTSSPSGKLQVYGASGDIYSVVTSGSVGYNILASTSASAVYTGTSTNHPLVFITNNTERMRIDASGNLLVGLTATGAPAVGYIFNTNGFLQIGRASGAAQSTIGFYNGSTFVGEVRTSTVATTYATSSDYRLKENIAPMQGALDVVQQLKPVTYNWKADGSSGQGFIAHELQAVVPDCVTGEKDAVDAEGKPQYQGIDTSFLVATLTKAIQEQQALIENLTTRLTALEGN